MIPSHEVVARSWSFGTGVSVMGGVCAEGTDRLFGWQFLEGGVCPRGCGRGGGGCVERGVVVQGG